MKVKIHRLFKVLLDSVAQQPEAVVGFSLSESPLLGDFLNDLDPAMSLDWNGRSFRGLPELREHVLRQAGLDALCAPDDVLITAGAAEANYLAITQLLQAGDQIVVETPGWPQAAVLAEAAGAQVQAVARREDMGWALPMADLAAAVTDRTRIIFLSNPNNPTGQVLNAAELADVVEIARKVGAWLIVDEVYAGLEWDGPRAPSVAGIYKRGITTGSVSKALGLQGLRTGWLICRDESLMMDAVILRENSSEIMNVMGEAIAEIALRPGRLDAAMARARAAGLANLAVLEAFIDAQPGLDWHRPRAGLIGLARLPKGMDGDAFAQALLAPPYRTFILPGSAYGCADHVRVGVGGDGGAQFALGLQRMAALLREWRSGRGISPGQTD
jgi:hypothetical protein